jgi:hypothetical protein
MQCATRFISLPLTLILIVHESLGTTICCHISMHACSVPQFLLPPTLLNIYYILGPFIRRWLPSEHALLNELLRVASYPALKHR